MKRINTSKALIGVFGLVLTAPPAIAQSMIIADSVSEFSGTQGQSNWYYGYYTGSFTPSNFQQMSIFDGTSWYVDNTSPSPFVWTQLTDVGGHPNGTISGSGHDSVEHWAVRRWVSEVNGEITIQGHIADLSGVIGDGIVGKIFVGNTEIYSTPINNGNLAGTNYSLTFNVLAGTTIDFAIAPVVSDYTDSTRFTATITVVPIAGTSWLFGLGLVVLIGGKNYRRKPIEARGLG
jgi:hypothetical protein